jgi:hypothetical protein
LVIGTEKKIAALIVEKISTEKFTYETNERFGYYST